MGNEELGIENWELGIENWEFLRQAKDLET